MGSTQEQSVPSWSMSWPPGPPLQMPTRASWTVQNVALQCIQNVCITKWQRARRQGLLPMVGEILRSHWTTIVHLKPVRCCPATVCHPHWVHGDKGPPEKQYATMAPGNHKQNHRKRPVLKLRCWNVRTMMTGLSASLQDIKDSRKTAVINDELRRLNMDIATLQETRLAESGTLKDYTFSWQGKRSDEPREHKVGFAVRNSWLRMVEPSGGSSKCLLTLCLNSTTDPVTLISPNTVHHTRHKWHVLREPCIHHQEHPQQGTSYSSGWLPIPERVQITTRGPSVLLSSEWAKWMKTGSDYWSCTPFMICA